MAEQIVSSGPPTLLPLTEEETVNRLCLLRSRRVGVATYRRLLAEHGTAAQALDALPAIAKTAGVSDYAVCPQAVALAEMKAGRKAGARLIVEGAPGFPHSLHDIGDGPPMLWVMGNIDLLARPAVALVGARNASSLGTRMAKRLAKDLCDAGITVISGLARGIDTAAHTGALAGGTVAVHAGGVDIVYPAENTQLADEIAAKGLRLSEVAMGIQPQARHFPARNRIISGLAQAVVVVEAAAKSGSLITARNALDQGRDVLAVPGHPFDARAWGCNMLLRDGATLVRDAQDVIEAISVLSPMTDDAPETKRAAERATAPEKPPKTLRDTAALHTAILARLGPSPVAEDQLLRDIRATPTDIAPVLIDLELEGKIIRQAGGLLARAH